MRRNDDRGRFSMDHRDRSMEPREPRENRRFDDYEESPKRGSGRSEGRFGRRDRDSIEKHQVICDSCGKECEVPFKPRTNKPVYCNDCFRNGTNTPKNERNKRSMPNDLEQINKKLDKIMRALKID